MNYLYLKLNIYIKHLYFSRHFIPSVYCIFWPLLRVEILRYIGRDGCDLVGWQKLLTTCTQILKIWKQVQDGILSQVGFI